MNVLIRLLGNEKLYELTFCFPLLILKIFFLYTLGEQKVPCALVVVLLLIFENLASVGKETVSKSQVVY